MFTGIDFSFSRVPPTVAAAAGHRFAVSYLTDLDTSHAAKAWTLAEVQSYRAAGLGVVAVWQGGGSDRTTAWRGGFDRGVRDARRAAQQSGVLGRPEGEGGRPVYFAVDFDVSAAELATVGRYFDGIASVFDLQNIGIYGGARVVEWARSSGKARWFWQTGAWSGGLKLPDIHLYQRTPPTKLAGYDVDIDEALQPDYGQWFDAPGGGTVPVEWIPGAQRIGRVSGGSMDTPSLPPRVVWHTVESPTGASYFRSMADYLLNAGVWPQVIYDPETDQLGQFCSLAESGRALRNDGDSRTNRTGRACIQIEVLGRAAQPFTEQPTWRPGPNFRALMAAIRSWGVPDVFPMGPPPRYPGGSVRDRSVWLNRAGHYCHANVPGNDHGDPGAISPSKLWAAAGGSTAPGPAPAPTPAPVEEEMPVIHGKLMPGYDDPKTITPVAPPTVPEGKRGFVNIVGGYTPILVRVDAWVGDKYVFLGEGFTGGKNGSPAFFELPKGTRLLHLKRVKPEDAIPELAEQAKAIAFEIFPDTPAAWNVEVV